MHRATAAAPTPPGRSRGPECGSRPPAPPPPPGVMPAVVVVGGGDGGGGDSGAVAAVCGDGGRGKGRWRRTGCHISVYSSHPDEGMMPQIQYCPNRRFSPPEYRFAPLQNGHWTPTSPPPLVSGISQRPSASHCRVPAPEPLKLPPFFPRGVWVTVRGSRRCVAIRRPYPQPPHSARCVAVLPVCRTSRRWLSWRCS